MRRLIFFLTFAVAEAGAEVGAGVGVGVGADAELRYTVSWLGIPFAEAEARLRRTDGEFWVRGEGWSAGPLAAFFNYKGFAETRGEWKHAGPVPRVHRNGGEFRGGMRAARVRWNGGESGPESETDPPPNLGRVSPVPEDALFGAVDPFSAALAAGVRIGREGACGGTEKVWDGRRLADWTLVDLGEDLPPDDFGFWEGSATVCELRFEKLGGFRRDSRHASKSPTRVWIAEVHPGLWAPVRAEVYSRWGKVVARLEVRGDQPGMEVAKP